MSHSWDIVWKDNTTVIKPAKQIEGPALQQGGTIVKGTLKEESHIPVVSKDKEASQVGLPIRMTALRTKIPIVGADGFDSSLLPDSLESSNDMTMAGGGEVQQGTESDWKETEDQEPSYFSESESESVPDPEREVHSPPVHRYATRSKKAPVHQIDKGTLRLFQEL